MDLLDEVRATSSRFAGRIGHLTTSRSFSAPLAQSPARGQPHGGAVVWPGRARISHGGGPESMDRVQQFLVSLFGYKPFRVRDLTASEAEELRELLGIPSGNDIGVRSKIGQWLSSHPEDVTVLAACPRIV